MQPTVRVLDNFKRFDNEQMIEKENLYQSSNETQLGQPYCDSESLLSGGSLVSTDLPIRIPLQNGSQEFHSIELDQHKTNTELMKEVLMLVLETEKLVTDPTHKDVLRKCEKLLTNVGVQTSQGIQKSGQLQDEEFVIITKDQIEEEAIAAPLIIKKHALMEFLFKTFSKASRNSKKLDRRESVSSVDLRTSTTTNQISRSFNDGYSITSPPG